MSTNNKSIHILRGTTGNTKVDSTVLEDGQPFYDRTTNTLRIGDGTSKIEGTSPVTVADGAITTNKLHSASNDESNPTGITTAKIENGAVNDAKIANNAAIKGSKLADASNDESNRTGITTAKIEDNAVTTDKLANASITAEKIQKDAILKDAIKDGEVVQGKLGANAVTESNIYTGAVTETKLGTDAVTTTKIKDRSITGDKLAEDFVFEQLGGQYTFTLSDGQSSEPTLEFADLHPSSNARVFLLADLEGKKDYQARLMLPTIADTEENTLATKEQIESGDIVAKEAVTAQTAQTTGFTNTRWNFGSSEVEVRDSALYEILVDNLFIVVGGGVSTNRGRTFDIKTTNSNSSTVLQYFDVYEATISQIEYTSYLTVSKTRYEAKNLGGYMYWTLGTRTQITDFQYRRIA